MNSSKNNVPEIRFPGFTDAWEQRKLGDLATFSKGKGYSKSDLCDDGNPIILYGRLYTKYETVITKVDSFTEAKDGSVYSVGGEVIVPASGETAEEISIASVVANSGVLLGGDLNIISPSDSLDPAFLAISITYGNPHNEMAKLAQGKTVVHLHNDDLKKIDLLFPSLEEQRRIRDLFNNIDNIITLHQHKCDELKIYKKGLLQQMFPQEGESVPRVRFPGFTNAWEQRELGDIIDKLTGGASIAPDDYVEEGYRTIPKGAVNDTGVADMSGCKCVSEAFFKKNISSKTSTGELVTSLRDLVPTAPNMGRIVRIYGDSEDFLMPQGVYSIVLKKDSDEDFLIAYSNSPDYRKIIATEKNGSTQVHIRNGEFLNIDIPVPTYDEQKRIGATIKNLDNLITLHQRKCKELKLYKRGLLQKMFV